ncbi:MAG: NAD-dependent epimerase/dehydratase family protein [Haloarculaceae archaeon]
MDALVIGGARFVGRHTVEELLAHGYDVTVFTRGEREIPFDPDRVAHVEGDRTVEGELRLAAERVDPDVVIDVVAYHPGDVRAATEIFADVDAYVYVSSGAAYGAERIPKREGETALEPCTAEQAADDSQSTYGARKAEGDRAVFEAADRGVNAMVLRPPVVYGPHDYTGRFDYWIDRVLTRDRVIVPGDGTNLWHRAYVADVASALRTVAESGEPGEAYNCGDRHVPTAEEWVDLLAAAADTEVEVVTAGARELGAADLAPTDFPLYRSYPHQLSTAKLAALGWEATPHETALSATVAEHRESDRTGREAGPDRAAEERVLGVLDTI